MNQESSLDDILIELRRGLILVSNAFIKLLSFVLESRMKSKTTEED